MARVSGSRSGSGSGCSYLFWYGEGALKEYWDLGL